MEYLKKYPNLPIARVARICNISETILRDEQLAFLRAHLKRNSKLWDTPGYGR